MPDQLTEACVNALAGRDPSKLAYLEKAAEELLIACIIDFASDLTEECGDDDAVMSGSDADSAIKFGHIRRLESALAAFRKEAPCLTN